MVRISGTDAFAVAAKITRLKKFEPNTIRPSSFVAADGTTLDRGLVAVFAAPNSYTGENVVELNCHGSDYLAQKLLAEALRCGARLAEPGEFTKRAFLSGKLDLTQVEAVSDMIAAGSDLSLNLALQHLEGDICREIRRLRKGFLNILAEIEAALDYPEEIADPPTEKIRTLLEDSKVIVNKLLSDSDTGLRIKSGAVVVLAGKPNAGKSSLFNALLRHNKAIVTNIPGTTRDALEATAQLGGLQVTLVDTAGWRETSDPLESLGVERSRAHLQNADLVLALSDAGFGAADTNADFSTALAMRPHLKIRSKIDLLAPAEKNFGAEEIGISVQTGENLDLLVTKILEKLNLRQVDISKNIYVSSLRQKNKLIQTVACLEKCLNALRSVDFLDVLAPQIKEIVTILGEITGDEVSEEIIEQIFSNFCVGK